MNKGIIRIIFLVLLALSVGTAFVIKAESNIITDLRHQVENNITERNRMEMDNHISQERINNGLTVTFEAITYINGYEHVQMKPSAKIDDLERYCHTLEDYIYTIRMNLLKE